MNDFVLDCSVAMTWCFEDETCDTGERAQDALTGGAAAVVPALWTQEVANVLLVCERRGRLTRDQTDAFSARLSRLPIVVWDGQATMLELLAAGRRFGLTAYDAEYLSLAAALGLPLATLDQDLCAVLGDAGVTRF